MRSTRPRNHHELSAQRRRRETLEVEFLGDASHLVTRDLDSRMGFERRMSDRDRGGSEAVRLMSGMANQVTGIRHRVQHRVRRSETHLQRLGELGQRE